MIFTSNKRIGKVFKCSFILALTLLLSCSGGSDESNNSLPIASFTFPDTIYYESNSVLFTDNSADRDGTVVSWSWDFGNGAMSTEQNPSYTYLSGGTYTVSLTVKDNENGSNTITKTIEILEGTSSGSKIIKIMTFNIHRGVSYLGEFDMDATADVIKAENPDYVMLQEVDYNTQRNGVIDMPKVLGEKTGMNYAFAKAIDYQGGEYGNAFLSKKTIYTPQNIALPSVNEERAVFKISSSISENNTIHLINAHFDHGTNSNGVNARKESATLINNTFAVNNVPSIVAGDFNEEPSGAAISILKQKWTFSDAENNFTFPSNSPTKKIDYIAFYPSNKWTLMDVKVINNTLASDHNPIVITIKLNN